MAEVDLLNMVRRVPQGNVSEEAGPNSTIERTSHHVQPGYAACSAAAVTLYFARDSPY